jgi:hypothetical protein
MRNIALDLSQCFGLGDLISATPVIERLKHFYSEKITVISPIPELFYNNPSVKQSFKHTDVNWEYIRANYTILNSFYNVGKKNEFGIEYRHNSIDIRQFHAINLGFTLRQNEMDCYYRPTKPNRFDFKDHIVIHPVHSWPSRTWPMDKWQTLVDILCKGGYTVVAIGKDSHETGFFDVNKPVMKLKISRGNNLVNQTDISDCWHLINTAKAVITMDSGILHLAGTTDTFIIQLGSNIHPEFRIPYRHGSQKYKYLHLNGKCGIYCGSDAKYGVKEWGTIQGVPPILNCLEGYGQFECHPTILDVLNTVKGL